MSADGRVATVATRLEKKPRDQQIPKRIPLTPTGLLMEGDYTNHRAMIDHDVTPTELDVKLVLAVYSSNSTSSPSEDFRRFPGHFPLFWCRVGCFSNLVGAYRLSAFPFSS